MEKLIVNSSNKETIRLVFLFIATAIIAITIILIFSKIRIQIINFRFSSQMKRHVNKDYKIQLVLSILGVIPILKINLNKAKLEKMKLKERMKRIDFKFLEENPSFNKEIWKALKQLNWFIEKIHLQIDIGTENASLTAIIVPVISTMIAIILRRKMKETGNQTFRINPVYINQNLVNLYISGIFEIKMRHIISVIYIINKKGVKKYERTSNRRSYDYSYE